MPPQTFLSSGQIEERKRELAAKIDEKKAELAAMQAERARVDKERAAERAAAKAETKELLLELGKSRATVDLLKSNIINELKEQSRLNLSNQPATPPPQRSESMRI